MENESELLLRLINNRYKSPDKILLYERYIESLVSRGVPPILSFRHLADILGIAPASLHCMAFKTNLYYKRFTIPKRSGGIRQIISPHLLLDTVQRWIGHNILQCAFSDFPEYVVGYAPNKSIKDHVTPHIKSDCLIKFDLKDFFPSITAESVCAIFIELGYVRSVARTLAALLTVDQRLPQGASTSPIVSNIYMRSFDTTLADYCEGKEFIYTRYADDIVISGASILPSCTSEIKRIFLQHGLALNHSKTRVYKAPSQVRFVTGLILKEGEVRLPKAMRRRIRVQCHIFLNEIDRLISHSLPVQRKMPQESWHDREIVFDPVFPERILGKLNYWLFVEPGNSYACSMKRAIQEKLELIQ